MRPALELPRFFLIALLSQPGCAAPIASGPSDRLPLSENELALRRLQTPLSERLCQTLMYPVADTDWPLSRIDSFVGRGDTYEEALEALCREAEGRNIPAIVDIYVGRTPNGWSPHYELRGTAVRFDENFNPPDPDEQKSENAQMPNPRRRLKKDVAKKKIEVDRSAGPI